MSWNTAHIPVFFVGVVLVFFALLWNQHHMSLPWNGVMRSFDLACAIRGERDRVIDQVGAQYGTGFTRDPAAWAEAPELRAAIGKAAKSGEGWFKRQDKAQEWAAIICPYLEDDALRDTDLVRKLTELRAWIDRA